MSFQRFTGQYLVAGFVFAATSQLAIAGRGEIGNWIFNDASKTHKVGDRVVGTLLPNLAKREAGEVSAPTAAALTFVCNNKRLSVVIAIDQAVVGSLTSIALRYGDNPPETEQWSVRKAAAGLWRSAESTAFFDRLMGVHTLELTIEDDKRGWSRTSVFELGEMGKVTTRIEKLC